MTSGQVALDDVHVLPWRSALIHAIEDCREYTDASCAIDKRKARLQALSDVVLRLVNELPQDVATQAVVDLRILVFESVKDVPRRERYALSARGLVDAADLAGHEAECLRVDLLRGLADLGGADLAEPN